jgi:amino acid adenylation domain-containing protein
MLARSLLACGLQQGDVVAVRGQRSFGFITGMTAVLASGGVLLNIDPDLPLERQRIMLRESGAKYLIRLEDAPPEEDGWLQSTAALIILPLDPDTAETSPSETPAELASLSLPAISPENPAYIFFTSGTIGIPKGVLGQHKGLSHFLHWQRETFAIRAQDRVAQLTALSFDVVLRDVFLPLTSGATLCLPPTEADLTPDRLWPWLQQQRISVLHMVPTLAEFWLSQVPPDVSLPALRWVFFAGEPLGQPLVRRWRDAFPPSEAVVNLYGPTETTLAKCFYVVPPDVAPGVQSVGFSLPHTQALILSTENNLCGIGEIGEIVIRTPFRSMGYINAPDENARRFVPNPYRNDAHDLLYYTGDLGRYQPDGTLEILGRTDHQIKIRGVRVEPDEVSAILAQHASVRSCLVVASMDEHNQNFLAAYVVASASGTISPVELRAYLSQRLPLTAVPTSFTFLDKFPLTANGKVDRHALPKPDGRSRELETAFVAPRTPIEEILVAIWRDVLGRERIGIHDNFFDLGGHSLLATQLISHTFVAPGRRFPTGLICSPDSGRIGRTDYTQC